jgi:hypothetical protein
MGVEGKKFASEKKAEPNDLAQRRRGAERRK